MLTTVIGVEGFLGASLRDGLLSRGLPAIAPKPGEVPSGHMGTVVFTAHHVPYYGWGQTGTTAREINAYLHTLLGTKRYDRFVFVSCAEVYANVPVRAKEETGIPIDIMRRSDDEVLEWLRREAAVLRATENSVVARIGRVYSRDGSEGGILGSMIQDALADKQIVCDYTLDSSIDFIGIANAVSALIRLIEGCEHRCYNLGSGFNVQIGDVADCLRRLTAGSIVELPNAKETKHATMSILRLQTEFGFVGTNIIRDLPMLVRDRLHQERDSNAA